MKQGRVSNWKHNDTSTAPSPARCLHCGTTIDSHKIPARGSSGASFCCAGCKAVYELLQRKGLGGYYELVARYGATITPPLQTPPHEIGIVSESAGHDSFTLQLGGIQCASCVWLLERLSLLCDGVLSARVSLMQGDISVRFDPARTSPADIASTIQSLGYSILPPSHTHRSGVSHDRHALMQIGIAGACTMNIMLLAVSLYQGLFTGIEAHYESLFRWVSLALAVPVVGYSAIPIYKKGLGSLKTGSLHIDLPISFGILLSFALSAFNTISGQGEIYFDSLATIVFLLLSTRYLQQRAFASARHQCTSHWSLLPSTIREVVDGSREREQPLAMLRAGMRLSVPTGERVPCDGVIATGSTTLDCSTITGEPLPVSVDQGAAVLAGSLNLTSPIQVLSVSDAGSSRLERILAEVSASLNQPPRYITTLDTFSMLFTASATILAGGAFLFSIDAGFQEATSAAIAMLTVTCPCAVALALPLLSVQALSTAAERGILVRSPEVFDSLPLIRSIFLDKTGTVTTGELSISRVEVAGSRSLEEFLPILAQLISIDPNHPVSRALAKWLPVVPEKSHTMREPTRIPGRGVSALIDVASSMQPVRAYLVSLSHFSSQIAGSQTHLFPEAASHSGPSVVLSTTEGDAVLFELTESLHSESTRAVQEMSRTSFVTILSGDREEAAQHIAQSLGLSPTQGRGGLLPEQKSHYVASAPQPNLYVGDGANDAPSLRAATVGIALRGGIQSILESADVFIERGGIEQVPCLHAISCRYKVWARVLVGLGLLYNAVGIGAAFFGLISPLIAAVAMPLFSSLLMTLSYMAFAGISSRKRR